MYIVKKHAKIFQQTLILFNKKFFDFSLIFRQYENYFEMKFLKLLVESNNFLLNIIFGQVFNMKAEYIFQACYSTK